MRWVTQVRLLLTFLFTFVYFCLYLFTFSVHYTVSRDKNCLSFSCKLVAFATITEASSQFLPADALLRCASLSFKIQRALCYWEAAAAQLRISRSNGKMRCKTPLPHPITEMQESATSVQFVVASSCSFLSYFVCSSFSLFLCLFFHPLSIKQLDF